MEFSKVKIKEGTRDVDHRSPSSPIGL
jgi:hypothetical protein